MTEAPSISIIIPTYNRAKLLKRAIESVLIQDYQDYEIIIVDNHSVDETSAVVNFYEKKNINYIKFKNNGNIAASRNIGINHAKGKWIAFLDSDDWWDKNKLSILRKYLNDSNDLVYHRLKIIKKINDNNVFSGHLKSRQLQKPIFKNLLLNGNVINNSSVIVRKSILDKIGGISENTDYIFAEDYHTWLKISQYTEKFCFVREALGYYLVHEENYQRIDMSIPTKKVISEFSDKIDNVLYKFVNANLAYMSARYDFMNKNYNNSIKKLSVTIFYSSFLIKCKIIYMFIIIFIKKISFSKTKIL